ncbi:hypothetical protein OHB04_02250 [Streptomyces sp. NBC_01775]|uniref:hypothetical protein n=1 Tax=Streptomyces sp. NBC_01775 TaxID=2975939 RepID=UPI002DD9647D|nr:hypothetical protein [Streptomyces sp. NBC_01775]WSB74714.1 hypothetical protein OHB04_02250 [Streptomyces sp. NBC_01775]
MTMPDDPPRPVTPRPDPAGADLGSQVDMGWVDPPPEPSPEPPPPPSNNPFSVEAPVEPPPDEAA